MTVNVWSKYYGKASKLMNRFSYPLLHVYYYDRHYEREEYTYPYK